MWIPGFGTEDPKQYKKFLTNDTLKAVRGCMTEMFFSLIVIFQSLKTPYMSSTVNAKSSNSKQQPSQSS